MKVKELIEALQKVENQDALVIFWDGEMNQFEIDLQEPLKVFEADFIGKWDDEKRTYHRYKAPAIELYYIGH